MRVSVGAHDKTCKLDPRRDADLQEDVAQMGLDRLLAQEQLGGDLGIGSAVDDESRYLDLALGQRVDASPVELAGARAPMGPMAELPEFCSARAR